VKPLQQAAQEYAASHGAGISAADEARLLDPRNTVNGGRIFRDERGVATVEINGRRTTLREAVRQGWVKVS
jgi:hypothetical protein